jgi:RNA polymerase sigma-70 factor (ECF subfamily)
MAERGAREREERFRDFFDRSYPALRRYASNRGLSAHDADDLVSATFEVAWARIDDVPHDDPVPWLFGVARNLLRKKRRTDTRRADLLARAWQPALPLGPSEPSAIDAATLRSALEQLDADDQEILRLVVWDDLNPARAAVVLGCTAIAARSRLLRARRRLAALLGLEHPVQRSGPSRQVKGEDAPSPTPTEVS